MAPLFASGQKSNIGLVTLLLALYVIAPGSNAEEKTVFKSKDASGNTLYSDQQTADAEEIVVESPQTFDAPQPGNVFQQKDVVKKVETGPAYELLRITNPPHDTAIRRNAGDVSVSFELKPALQPNHSVQVLVDGKAIRTKKSTGPFALTNLDRGTHQFQVAVVEDESGEVIHASDTVTTTILRVSIIRRAN